MLADNKLETLSRGDIVHEVHNRRVFIISPAAEVAGLGKRLRSGSVDEEVGVTCTRD